MTVDDKLDSIIARLDRLDLIESHLLDILIPQRKSFLKNPKGDPTPLVRDNVSSLAKSVKSLREELSSVKKKLHTISDKEKEEETF